MKFPVIFIFIATIVAVTAKPLGGPPQLEPQEICRLMCTTEDDMAPFNFSETRHSCTCKYSDGINFEFVIPLRHQPRFEDVDV